MLSGIEDVISSFKTAPVNVNPERKQYLDELIDFIQQKTNSNESIRLIFICTHNSRRSHLTQIWCQTMAFYFGVKNLNCYSGGTEATAMFHKIVETLIEQGFQIAPIINETQDGTEGNDAAQLAKNKNIIYSVKYAINEPPLICFSKLYKNSFNPVSDFAAVMTCASADQGL